MSMQYLLSDNHRLVSLPYDGKVYCDFYIVFCGIPQGLPLLFRLFCDFDLCTTRQIGCVSVLSIISMINIINKIKTEDIRHKLFAIVGQIVRSER